MQPARPRHLDAVDNIPEMAYGIRQDVTCRVRSCKEGMPIVYKLVNDRSKV